MAYRQDWITVEVKQRILWIGAAAYPVQNIARAQRIKLPARHGAAVLRFIWTVVLWVVLGFGGLVIVSHFSVPDLGINVPYLIAGIVLVAIIVGIIRLIRGLMVPTLYALVIETAGTPYTALVTSERYELDKLVGKIMGAINDPQVKYEVKVKRFHVGDRIKQVGERNIGKVS